MSATPSEDSPSPGDIELAYTLRIPDLTRSKEEGLMADAQLIAAHRRAYAERACWLPRREGDILTEANRAANAIIGQQADEMKGLSDALDRMTAERDHWEANAREATRVKRALLDRPDLKDRAQSVMLLMADLYVANGEVVALERELAESRAFWQDSLRDALRDRDQAHARELVARDRDAIAFCTSVMDERERANALAAALRDLLAPPGPGDMDPVSVMYDNMMDDAIEVRARAALDAYDRSFVRVTT